MSASSSKYDKLYLQAHDFIKNCNDKEKVRELLKILDETDEDRQALMVAEVKDEKRKEKAID